MPNFQATFYFTTIDNEGWSDNIFINEADINTAASSAAAYIPLRMALCASNVDMVYAKVSDTSIKGDSLLITPAAGSYPIQGTYTETPTGCFLEANTALLIVIKATSTKLNRIFIRGLTLDVVTGRRYLMPSAFDTALTALTTFLSTGVQVRTADKPLTKPPTYTYAPAVNAYFNRVTARKPGRPFAPLRGRKFAHRTAAIRAGRSLPTSVPATPPRPALPRVPRR